MTNAFTDIIDERTRGTATPGPSARRKTNLRDYDTRLQLLDQAPGVDIEHRQFNPDNERAYPTTAVIDAGTGDDTIRVHLFQDVRETDDTVFGDFGTADAEKDDVVWTVVDLCDETVTLTVVGDWGKRRTVPFAEFADTYDPIYIDVPGREQQVPRYGY